MLKSQVVRVLDDYQLNEDGTRAVARQQPAAVQRNSATHVLQAYWCFAEVAKKRTGRAKGWTFEQSAVFHGATEADVVAARERWISQYLRVREKHARASDQSADAERESEEQTKRLRRDAAPAAGSFGPAQGRSKRAGPGRGRTLVETQAAQHDGARSEVEEPPPPSLPKNWLERVTLKKQWQTEQMDFLEKRVRSLERELLLKDAQIQEQAHMIENLRKRVRMREFECQCVCYPLCGPLTHVPHVCPSLDQGA